MSNKENDEDNKDILRIPCLKCGQEHNYRLDVKRSYILYNYSLENMNPIKKKFTRMFTCPVKDQEYQVTFSLIQTFGTIIEDVTVKGVKDGSSQENNSKKE